MANRLTGESGTDGAGRSYSKTYNLDSAGNRLASSYSLDGALQSQATYSYNSLDWMNSTSVQSSSGTNSTTFGYDANGAQTSQTTASGTSAQAWDFEGHLRAQGQVDASGNWNGARTNYSYDASGMRLTQAAFNAAGTLTSGTSYVWNGDRVAEERDASGVLQGVYEHGQELGPLRLRRLKDGAWQNRFFIGDGQDSTRQLMNEAGLVTDSYFYDAFGTGLNGGQGVTNNSFKYTGQQQDSSGLYYLRARYYNSGTGRFLSQDPEMGSADDPVSMHRYLYASGDPANFSDPTGRESLGEVMMSTSLAMNLQSMKADMDQAILEEVAGAFGLDATREGLAAHFINQYTGTNLTGGDIRAINDITNSFTSGGGFDPGLMIGAAGDLSTVVQGMASMRSAASSPLVKAEEKLVKSGVRKLMRKTRSALNRYRSGFSRALTYLRGDDGSGSGSGIGCFVAGTPVLMADGSKKPIEKLQVGDWVMSRNSATGATAAKKVLRVTVRTQVATLVLHLANGQSIETTANHPFFISSPKPGAPAKSVPAGQLAIGNSIVTRAGPPVALAQVELTHQAKTVYNCTVEDFHTYFVGTNALWVHNVDCDIPDEDITEIAKHAIGRHPDLVSRLDLPMTKPAVESISSLIKEVVNTEQAYDLAGGGTGWKSERYRLVLIHRPDSPGFRGTIFIPDGDPEDFWEGLGPVIKQRGDF